MSESGINLTKRAIESFRYDARPPRNDYRWDAQIRGFGVRIYPSNEKSYVLSYRFNRRKKLIVLGKCAHMDVKTARREARAKLAEVDRGVDPNARSRQVRFDAFSQVYIDNYARPHKRTWETDLGRIKRHLLPKWRAMPLDEISRADVLAMHRRIGQKAPVEANRVLSLVSSMFKQAQLWGDFPEDRLNPAFGIKKNQETKRDRWVTAEEMPRLSKALAAESNRTAAAAIEFMLLTGLRRGECLGLTWHAVSEARRELRLGRTKSGRIHYVPLSEPALRVLERQKGRSKGRYVFPGVDPEHPLVNIDKAWRRIRREADMPDLRIHDLRRTFGSWMAQQGESLHLIGKVLNHTSPQTTAIYARFRKENIQHAIESVGEKLDQTMKYR